MYFCNILITIITKYQLIMKKLILLLFAITTMATIEAQNVYIAPSKSAIAYHKNKDCSYLRNSVNVTAVKQSEAKDMGRHACVRCYPELKEKTMKDIAKGSKTKKSTTTKTATAEAKTAKNVYITSAKGATAYHKNKSCSYLKKATDVKSISAEEASEMKRVPCKACYPNGAAKTTKKTTSAKKSVEKNSEKKATTTSTAKKNTPARDEKGRFVKKTTEETKSSTKKTTPARDEKGRFVKKTTEETKSSTKKTTPARDEKGRFVKTQKAA